MSAHLSSQLAAAVSSSHGFEPRVLVRTLAELERAAAGNPFPEADDDPKSLHLFFLEKPAKRPDLRSLEALKTQTERFVLKDNIFYLHTPERLRHVETGQACRAAPGRRRHSPQLAHGEDAPRDGEQTSG